MTEDAAQDQSDNSEPQTGLRAGLPGGSRSAWARSAIYVSILALAMVIAFFAGTASFVATECSGPDFGGECDLAALGGILWAFVVFIVGIVAVVTIEVLRAHKLRARRRRV